MSLDLTPSQEAKLKARLRVAVEPWAQIYAKDPNAEHLILSMLKGAEFRLLERLGRLSEEGRSALRAGMDGQAFLTGKEVVDEIDIRRFKIN